ncbi:hypothetical protein Q0590_37140 [Rhodocytophaga aerolata]|uniref:Uncharacterized protein n=1 Tax=Rhodocytophaga aerolata TaxID=455078 RepID=A0ABT8RIY5_9BACT|nr:hypothetical protein [Rhodocytophaga aerolata]MDO1451954.1 hypothetical protein [Rhodocytophaga aerolata]
MKNRKGNRVSQISNWSKMLPIGTLLIAVLLSIWSIYYKPSLSYSWTEMRPQMRDSVRIIEEYGAIPGEFVGIAATTPQQWYTREWLMNNAKENELIKLLEYPNGVVKATAYEALVKQSSLDKYSLLSQVLNDTITFVYYQSGCQGEMLMLGEYILKHVIYLPSDKTPSPQPGALMNLELAQVQVQELQYLYEHRMEKKKQYLKEKFKQKI